MSAEQKKGVIDPNIWAKEIQLQNSEDGTLMGITFGNTVVEVAEDNLVRVTTTSELNNPQQPIIIEGTSYTFVKDGKGYVITNTEGALRVEEIIKS